MKDRCDCEIDISPEVISSMVIQPFENLTLFLSSELANPIKRVNIDINKSNISIDYYESM
ncbi:hypothetical protein [Clostridioides difficile]|uniref:hypothetical protein n=1 Tax=Clostridioides difficile TaxID=1496 RepID=UPI00374F2556